MSIKYLFDYVKLTNGKGSLDGLKEYSRKINNSIKVKKNEKN